MPAKPSRDQLAGHYYNYTETPPQQLVWGFFFFFFLRWFFFHRAGVFKDLVRFHLCLEQASREAVASRQVRKTT